MNDDALESAKEGLEFLQLEGEGRVLEFFVEVEGLEVFQLGKKVKKGVQADLFFVVDPVDPKVLPEVVFEFLEKVFLVCVALDKTCMW